MDHLQVPTNSIIKVLWLLLSVACWLGAGAVEAQTPGSLDPTFRSAIAVVPGSVSSVAVQTDGKIIVAGTFSVAGEDASPGVTRFNTDGSRDTGFNSSAASAGYVVVQPDGKILLGNASYLLNGTSRSGIVRLNTNGSLDTGFISGQTTSDQTALRVQGDGKILVAGGGYSSGGAAYSYLVRLNTDGSVDGSFDPGSGTNTFIYSMMVQTDGKILIAGDFTSFNGSTRNRIARLNADGSLDASFNPGSGVNNSINAMLVQPTGKILIGGAFTPNGAINAYAARLNADGSVDTSFVPDTSHGGIFGPVTSLALQADGKVVLGGTFQEISYITHKYIARLNADGSLDNAFNPLLNTGDQVSKVAVQSDGKILLAGRFGFVNGVVHNSLARVAADGSLDAGFNPVVGNGGSVAAMALQANGKLLIGGNFTSISGLGRVAVARLNADGSLDTGFTPGTMLSTSVVALAVQGDGKIIVSGSYGASNAPTYTLNRLNTDGTIDASFNTGKGPGGSISSLAVQGDGKVIVAGNFSSFNGTASKSIVRLNTDGSLDTGFNVNFVSSYNIYAVAVQGDGKIVVVGGFNGFYLARLNTDGSFDGTFGAGASGPSATVNSLTAVAAQQNGKIDLGGVYSFDPDDRRSGVVQFNANGSRDTAFALSKVDVGSVHAIAAQGNGKVLFCGSFTTINSNTPVNALARVNTDGSLDTSFNAGLATYSYVSNILVQPDGKILITGSFALASGNAATIPARLLGDPPLSMVTSSLVASGQAGSAFSYQTVANNSPSQYAASGLPGGLSIDPASGLISGTPSQPGVFKANLSITNANGTSNALFTLTVTDTFSNWQATNFSPAELGNPAISGPLGDATGAGVTNLLKYALGIPAKQVGLAGLPVVGAQYGTQAGSSSKYLTVTYTREKVALGVSLTVQVSSDLVNWYAGKLVTEVSRVDNGNGTETVVTRDSTAVGGAVRHFIRLQASQP